MQTDIKIDEQETVLCASYCRLDALPLTAPCALTTLLIDGATLTALPDLARFAPLLTALSVARCRQLTALTSLPPSLTVLDARQSGVCDWSGLAQTPHLTRLSVAGCGIATLDSFPRLDKLVFWSLAANLLAQANAVIDGVLRVAPGLTQLCLSSNPVCFLGDQGFMFDREMLFFRRVATALPGLHKIDGHDAHVLRART